MMEVETLPISPPELIQTQPHEKQNIPLHIRQQNADNNGVGVDLDKSSVVKPRKTRSKVWEDFVKYKDENGKDWAKCKVCEKVFDGCSKLGTTHLRNHFNSCQRKRNGGGGADNLERNGGGGAHNLAGNLSDTIANKEKSVMDQQSNHLHAARMILKQGDASLINTTNKGYIIDVYQEEKKKLRNYFEKLSCRFCLRLIKRDNRYHRDVGCTYLMVWFIDDDWKLQNKIIGLKYSNDDKTVMKDVKNVLLELGIEKNLFSMVIDGDFDSNLCEMISCIERDDWFSNQGSLLFNNKLHCFSSFRCADYFLEHSDIRTLLYESLKRLFNNIKETLSKNENFQDALDLAIASLGKEVTAPVISMDEELLRVFLWGEVGYLLRVLKTVLGLRKTIFQLENNHPHFQNLTEEEWAIYECFEDLGDSDFLPQYRSNYNTANTYFPLLCSIYKSFKEMRKRTNILCDDLIKILDNQWCEYNLVLAVASVLDPRFKMDIVKKWYEKIFGDGWETEFTKFTNYFTEIYTKYGRETNSSISYEMLDPLGKPCKSSYEPILELHLYLEVFKFPSFQDFDILEWWRVHARCFPTLARMARDFLSIRISPPTVLYDEKCLLEELGFKEAYIWTNSWLAPEEMSRFHYPV